MKIEPFLRWPGGKRWLVSTYSSIFDVKFNNFYEPFLGSGTVFFHIQPERAILSDINKDLIDTYNAIKQDHEKVLHYLKQHQKHHSTTYYYRIRDSIPRSLYTKAARFIYLNRTCWNGLYRVNSVGRFNVPIGTKTNVILSSDNFEAVSHILKKAKVLCCDFETTINKAKIGDLVFVDPPYVVSHLNNGFLKYNGKLFSWSDQERLAKCLKGAKRRGVKIIGTNAYNKSVIELYKNVFSIKSLNRASVISGKKESRGKIKELLIFG